MEHTKRSKRGRVGEAGLDTSSVERTLGGSIITGRLRLLHVEGARGTFRGKTIVAMRKRKPGLSVHCSGNRTCTLLAISFRTKTCRVRLD